MTFPFWWVGLNRLDHSGRDKRAASISGIVVQGPFISEGDSNVIAFQEPTSRFHSGWTVGFGNIGFIGRHLPGI
jgi:hypothetical protein